MRINRKSIALVLMLLALLIPTLMAFAKGMSAMDISGPGIDGTMHLDDTDQLESLMRSGFFDMSTRLSLPDQTIESLGKGYEITFYFSEAPDMAPFHQETLIYYPDPKGGDGYQHWIGGGDPAMPIKEASQWTRVRAGENDFWRLMEANGVTRPEVQSASLPQSAAPAVIEEPAEQAPVMEEAAPVVAQNTEPQAADAQPTPDSAPPNWTLIAAAVTASVMLVGAGAWITRQRAKPAEHQPAGD